MTTETGVETAVSTTTEETQNETIQTTNETTSQETPSVEDLARSQGWVPIEEFSGDKSKYVSAETFVAKGELIDRIEQLGKKLKDSEKTIKMLSEHHTKVKESEFKRAVEFLKQQKKQAYENGDVDKILELDDKIAEVRDTQKAQKQQEQVDETPEAHPAFQSWVSENKWYESDSEMRADADAFGEAYTRNNQDKTPQEVLEYVAKKIKKAYPEKFTNPNRNKPTGVESGNGIRQGSSRDSFTLTEEETRVMNTFARNGIMEKEEYIKQVKAMRGAN